MHFFFNIDKYWSNFVDRTKYGHVWMIHMNRSFTKSLQICVRWYLKKVLFCVPSKIIIIIIMLHYQHRYPWSSLATPPYYPLLLVGPRGYIPYQLRAAVCMFELIVLPLHVHVKGFTGVHCLWAHPYISSSVWNVWFV